MLLRELWQDPEIKGCLVPLGASVGIVTVVAPLVPKSGAGTAALLPALAAVVLLYLGAWYGLDAIRSHADAQLVRRALREELPEDGLRSAAVGVLEPLASPLQAPLSGRECVAYSYRLYRWHSGSVQRVRPHYWGFRIAPSAVRTRSGPVKLLGSFGGPMDEELMDDASYARAESYLAACHSAQDRGALAGELREDSRSNEPAVPLSELNLREACLHVGAPVCVIGIYSKQREGLVADASRAPGTLSLIVAEPGQALRHYESRVWRSLLLGACWAATGLAVVLFVS